MTTERNEIVKTRTCGRLKVTFVWRSAKQWMGRFGGGWNWKVGVSVGRTTVIFWLLFCYLTVSWRKPTC